MQYQHYIANDHALVMEEDGAGGLAGFSVILGPRTMEATGLRGKAERIEGSSVRIGELDPDACAYWEQLAFRPRYAKGLYPVYLAFASLRRAFLRYAHLFGAVVEPPAPEPGPSAVPRNHGLAGSGVDRRGVPGARAGALRRLLPEPSGFEGGCGNLVRAHGRTAALTRHHGLGEGGRGGMGNRSVVAAASIAVLFLFFLQLLSDFVGSIYALNLLAFSMSSGESPLSP